MRLWIIGNGFDLYHGLKTKYADYKAYLCQQYACELKKQLQEDSVRGACRTACRNCCKNYRSFDCPVRKFNDLPRDELKEDLWSDLEESCSLDLDRLLEGIIGDWIGDGEALKGSIALAHGVLDLSKVLTGYGLYDWLCEVEKSIPGPKAKEIEINQGDAFLTFNYTKTLQKVYGILPERIHYVHGCVDQVGVEYSRKELGMRDVEKNGIVHSNLSFGTSDMTDDAINAAFERNVKPSIVITEQMKELRSCLSKLIKSLRKDVKSRKELLEKWVKEQCDDPLSVDEIIVAGHSLGRIDGPYFDFLTDYFRCVKWRFLFHSKDDLEKAVGFCNKHGLYGYYMPWKTAGRMCFANVPCSGACGISCPGLHSCKS